jgi:hypothetical protein
MSKHRGVVCPMSGQRSISFAGYDQCPGCGKIVYTRASDGCYSRHYCSMRAARSIIEHESARLRMFAASTQKREV